VNLDKIRSRCFVDEFGCWHWLGYTTHGEPAIKIERRVQRVARVVYDLTHSKSITGRYTGRSCGCRTCVSPEHIRAVTRSQYVKRTIGKRKYVSPSERARAKIASGTVKLSREKASEIRQLRADTGASLRQLAARFAVSRSTVHHVVQNKT
jgi:hypothetical protein